MHDQLLTTYSFFSALTENGKDIYNSVYIPICKRCISLFAKSKTYGTDSDIQAIMKSEYGIEVPLLVLRRLIKAVAKDLSRRDKQKFEFQVTEKRNSFSFSFKSFSFNNIEETYESQRRRTNALQEAFELFVKQEYGEIDQIPKFAEFIDKNKKKTSSFLTGDNKSLLQVDDSSFMPHVRFLQYIESNNDVLYRCVQQIFIGSLIATYLESDVDLEAKIDRGTVYYLDTQVVLELLDLQREEDTKPANELVKLIKDAGGVIRILNITCNEITKAIDNTIATYSRTSPSSTINEACIRIQKNKTWLIELAGHLKEHLSKKFGFNFDDIPDNDQEAFKSSNDAEELKKIWFNKRGAEHDVMAYLFVRKRRKSDKNKTLLQKASYWFVTENPRLFQFNMKMRDHENVNEIIMPEELTSLLFLQNPSKFYNRVSVIGLNELIAQTLSDEYPSRDLINDFYEAVSSNENISTDDYKILLSAISQESTKKIRHLIDDSTSNKTQFHSEISEILAKSRKDKAQEKKNREQDKAERKKLEGKNLELKATLESLSKRITDLEEADKKKSETIKAQKRWKIIMITIIIILILALALVLYPTMYEWLKKVITALIGLSGLWTLLNFILNFSSKARDFYERYIK